ncbi:MAG: hypothetical protein ABJM29_10685 [Rhizobiaceae bacterium]
MTGRLIGKNQNRDKQTSVVKETAQRLVDRIETDQKTTAILRRISLTISCHRSRDPADLLGRSGLSSADILPVVDQSVDIRVRPFWVKE